GHSRACVRRRLGRTMPAPPGGHRHRLDLGGREQHRNLMFRRGGTRAAQCHRSVGGGDAAQLQCRSQTMSMTTFINARIFDGVQSDYVDESVLTIDGNRIVELGRVRSGSAGETIDVRGNTLMPGLIDAHCHVLGSSLKITEVESQPLTYVAQYAARMLSHALDCGFTTVRDVGGGDAGIAQAVEHGFIKGPRVFYAGRALSMTGGHGDFRDPVNSLGACGCGAEGRVSVVVDGKDAVRAAVREELRRGAHCIKLMLSGGVLSPTDPIWMDQFSDEEVLVAVEEARRRRKYVAAHCHPPAS